MDAAIIGAAQRVEHYEIAGYGTVKAFADLLGENEHVSLIDQTLAEEKQADDRLRQLGAGINSQAADQEDEGDGPDGRESKVGSGKGRRAA